MNWKLFIAKRVYRSNEGGKEVSKPAGRIAMLGIAIGLAVMIVSVAVVIGFKHEVRDKVIGLGSDIKITNFDARKSFETIPIVVNDSLLNVLYATKGVKHVQRYSTKPGMIMTDDSWYVVRNIRGVTGFVGAGNKAWPLSETDFASVFNPEPKVQGDIHVGDEVGILSGLFENFTGRVTELDEANGRIKVVVPMLKHETDVELNLDEVIRAQE